MSALVKEFLQIIDVDLVSSELNDLFKQVEECKGVIDKIEYGKLASINEKFTKELMYFVGFCLFIKRMERKDILK